MSSPANEVEAIAEEAHIFFYPLVLMDVTRQQLTNVAGPQGMAAPMNVFGHFRGRPPLDFTTVVRPTSTDLGPPAHSESNMTGGE